MCTITKWTVGIVNAVSLVEAWIRLAGFNVATRFSNDEREANAREGTVFVVPAFGCGR